MVIRRDVVFGLFKKERQDRQGSWAEDIVARARRIIPEVNLEHAQQRYSELYIPRISQYDYHCQLTNNKDNPSYIKNEVNVSLYILQRVEDEFIAATDNSYAFKQNFKNGVLEELKNHVEQYERLAQGFGPDDGFYVTANPMCAS